MGLPIWRTPVETKVKDDRTKSRSEDPTAAARSTIRRRPEIHGRERARPRHSLSFVPRLERTASLYSPRRPADRLQDAALDAIPPIRNLFETADGIHSITSQSSTTVDTNAGSTTTNEVSASGPHALGTVDARVLRDVPFDLQQALRALESASNSTLNDDASENLLQRIRDADEVSIAEMRRVLAATHSSAQEARPHSRDGQASDRNVPTPLRDLTDNWTFMDIEHAIDGLAHWLATNSRPTHPLRNSWRPGSPAIDGLGDRTRSPTPDDGWEIMRSTITPDDTLPSADSSFTSAVASRSFGSSNVSQAEGTSSSRTSSEGAQAVRRSLDDISQDFLSGIEDYQCTDDEPSPEVLGRAIFLHVQETEEGRERLEGVMQHQAEAGIREMCWQIGLRIIQRLVEHVRDGLFWPDGRFPEIIRRALLRRLQPETNSSRYARAEAQLDAARRRLAASRPDGINEAFLRSTQAADTGMRDYIERITRERQYARIPPASSEARADERRQPSQQLQRQQQRLLSHAQQQRQQQQQQQQDQQQSRPIDSPIPDGPFPPNEPISPLSESDETPSAAAVVMNAVGSTDYQDDLDSLRTIIDRLAARDDVPEDLWMSIGLNLSRTRPRNRSPTPRGSGLSARVRSGRVERSSATTSSGSRL